MIPLMHTRKSTFKARLGGYQALHGVQSQSKTLLMVVCIVMAMLVMVPLHATASKVDQSLLMEDLQHEVYDDNMPSFVSIHEELEADQEAMQASAPHLDAEAELDQDEASYMYFVEENTDLDMDQDPATTINKDEFSALDVVNGVDNDLEMDDANEEPDLTMQMYEEQRRREKKEARREVRKIRKARKVANRRRVRGPVYSAPQLNGTDALNGTDSVNGTLSNSTQSGLRRKKINFNKRWMSSKERTLLEKTKKLEKHARSEAKKANKHEGVANRLTSIFKNKAIEAAEEVKNGKITYELSLAVDAMNSVKNDLEKDDLQQDAIFWDAFYGKPTNAAAGQATNATTNTLSEPESIMNHMKDQEAIEKNREKAGLKGGQRGQTNTTRGANGNGKDMALPLYKSSYIATFDEAYGRSKKLVKLDDELKRDGDTYLSYISLFN